MRNINFTIRSLGQPSVLRKGFSVGLLMGLIRLQWWQFWVQICLLLNKLKSSYEELVIYFRSLPYNLGCNNCNNFWPSTFISFILCLIVQQFVILLLFLGASLVVCRDHWVLLFICSQLKLMIHCYFLSMQNCSEPMAKDPSLPWGCWRVSRAISGSRLGLLMSATCGAG